MSWLSLVWGKVLGVTSAGWFYLLCFGAGMGAGLYTCHVWHKAGEASIAQAQVKQIVKQDNTNQHIAEVYEGKIQTLQSLYSNLGDKYAKLEKQHSVVTSDCKLTPYAVRVWDSSSQGVSSDTQATTGTSTGTSDVAGGVSIPIEFAAENKLKWDNYYNEIKEKLLAIKQWDKEQFGD